jgi:hypothetical protein
VACFLGCLLARYFLVDFGLCVRRQYGGLLVGSRVEEDVDIDPVGVCPEEVPDVMPVVALVPGNMFAGRYAPAGGATAAVWRKRYSNGENGDRHGQCRGS